MGGGGRLLERGVNSGFTAITAIIYYTRYFGRYFLQEAPYCFLLTMFHDTALRRNVILYTFITKPHSKNERLTDEWLTYS